MHLLHEAVGLLNMNESLFRSSSQKIISCLSFRRTLVGSDLQIDFGEKFFDESFSLKASAMNVLC